MGRTAFLSAEGAEGRGELLFIHEGTRRDTKNTLFPRRNTEGHGELLFCPRKTRRDAENSKGVVINGTS